MSAAVLPILTGPNTPLLRARAKEVKTMTKELKKLIEKMQVTVRAARGIGLAAPQVGFGLRIILAQVSGTFVTMINPEILDFSAETEVMEEGCLSLPGQWGMVERPREIMVRFQNPRGEEQKLYLKKLAARVVQHEVDHLDGILFIDRIPGGKTYQKEEKKSND